jgi:hypothetical protein
MRTDYRMSTRHHFWKLFQRLEELVELWGMSAAEVEALKERLSNVKVGLKKTMLSPATTGHALPQPRNNYESKTV